MKIVKIAKGKPPKPSNENDLGPVAIAGAGTTPNNLKALAKAFAPVVELRATKGLKVNPRNARSHSARQVQQIAASVREFGWVAPIVVDEGDTVLAGHGRLRAALLLNMEAVPTIQVKHAANCELNYTPQRPDGSVDISRALEVNVEFDISRQLWSYLVNKGGLLTRVRSSTLCRI